jgi:hypothetical protein
MEAYLKKKQLQKFLLWKNIIAVYKRLSENCRLKIYLNGVGEV